MQYIIDIALIALFVLSIYSAARRGIFVVIADIAAAGGAMVLAKLLGDRISPLIYENNIKNTVLAYLSGIFSGVEITGESIKNKISETFGFLPDSVRNTLFSQGNIDLTKLNYNAMSTVDAIESQIVRPVVTGILKTVVYLLLFIVLVIIIRMILRFILKRLTPRPLKRVGTVLGGVFGAFKGVLYVVIAANILIVISYSYEPLNKAVESSLICGFISQNLSVINLLS
ncbi:MAG: CvpA family protein [Oscillospiraceae bacterium]|nr:CvpA family protein [Oscillospiraceae bacterium]MDD7353850.1 CvpA family protein [Oscillospiraceae bacterium]MDY3937897.1 CvpA family protein [Oscillospiraceae bacterium]